MARSNKEILAMLLGQKKKKKGLFATPSSAALAYKDATDMDKLYKTDPRLLYGRGLMKSAAGRTPKNVGEGISKAADAIFGALAMREGLEDVREKERIAKENLFKEMQQTKADIEYGDLISRTGRKKWTDPDTGEISRELPKGRLGTIGALGERDLSSTGLNYLMGLRKEQRKTEDEDRKRALNLEDYITKKEFDAKLDSEKVTRKLERDLQQKSLTKGRIDLMAGARNALYNGTPVIFNESGNKIQESHPKGVNALYEWIKNNVQEADMPFMSEKIESLITEFGKVQKQEKMFLNKKEIESLKQVNRIKIIDYKNFEKQNQNMMERYGKELVKGKDGKYTLKETDLSVMVRHRSKEEKQIEDKLRKLNIDPTKATEKQKINAYNLVSKENFTKKLISKMPSGVAAELLASGENLNDGNRSRLIRRAMRKVQKNNIMVSAIKGAGGESMKKVNAVRSTLVDLDMIEQMVQRIFRNKNLMGRIKQATVQGINKITQSNNDMVILQGLIDAVGPGLARTLGHTGVLTELDISSVKKLLPKMWGFLGLPDSEKVALEKVRTYRNIIINKIRTSKKGNVIIDKDGNVSTPFLENMTGGLNKKNNTQNKEKNNAQNWMKKHLNN
tara:strand:+ start:16279 stop:18135 length:1857 start_codon:yes stop_codon:yes gene_type:complete